ncbi:ComEC/Rec2 family competence protein [Alishewanella tabrizica]|uniref:DNA internalization-related competence protein ComEC/Rec2 n=1 Tax=Alishewanella tabrizica TaxID=671278 RepID=A0ABQ2WLV8_9ALTE|nr:ComEC/Rec2 family competence protein [Alishewanella tabrizica]GGW59857.1 DNA internalization-related competence protein ComEC/Rec2 [Alishewanella tabrizica]
MQTFCTGVIAGCLLSLLLPALPPFFLLIAAGAVALSFLCKQYFIAGVSVFILIWLGQLQHYQHAQTALFASTQQYYDVRIVAQRRLDEQAVLLHLIIRQGEAQGYQLHVHWRDAPATAVGQHWRLALRLRPVSGHRNPHQRSRETQALLQGVLAEGYVDPNMPSILLHHAAPMRQRIISQLAGWTHGLSSAPLLMALTVGERAFSPDLWLGIQHSGLGHILTISGLHIGLVFGWGYAISKILLSRTALPQREVWQLCSALVLALLYAWLAGFAIPTLRAAAALLLVLGSRVLLRPLQGRYAWQLLVAVLLLINPFWALSYSFWLSVLAVGIIIFLAWWLPAMPNGIWAKLRYFCLFHLVLTSLMSLIGAAFFGGISMLAWLSNLLFVTWCSLVAIPVLLITLCWSLVGLPLAHFGWQLADMLFRPLYRWLVWSAEQPVWWTVPELNHAVVLLLALAVLIYIALRQTGPPAFMLFATLIIAFYIPRQVQSRIILLDSGQSTVLLAQQAGHTWLYLDANPAQLEQLVRYHLLPQLRVQRIHALGPVIIPKVDPDMLPALTLLSGRYPDIRFYTTTPITENSYACQQIVADFPLLPFTHWPLATADPCVLSTDFAGWQVLLPGRLTRTSEQQLLASYPYLQADFYLLADYGRASANSLPWLAHLAPVTLLLSANQQGAHQYPLRAVQQRIDLLNLPLYHTGQQGAITLTFTEKSFKILAERSQSDLRWLEKPAE